MAKKKKQKSFKEELDNIKFITTPYLTEEERVFICVDEMGGVKFESNKDSVAISEMKKRLEKLEKDVETLKQYVNSMYLNEQYGPLDDAYYGNNGDNDDYNHRVLEI